MKKIIFFFLLIVTIGCSNSDSASNDSIGQGGSLAVFALKGNYLYSVDHMKLNVFSLTESEFLYWLPIST